MREDVREDVKMSRCERRCEDEKMFYRPPLLEEPCAQTLSGTTFPKGFLFQSVSPISIVVGGQKSCLRSLLFFNVVLEAHIHEQM